MFGVYKPHAKHRIEGIAHAPVPEMMSHGNSNPDYLSLKLAKAEKTKDVEEQGLKTIIQSMCNEIGKDLASDEFSKNSGDLIVPANEVNSDLVFYKIYEVLWQDQRNIANSNSGRKKDLSFSVLIPRSNTETPNYDADMIKDVRNFFEYFVKNEYKTTSGMWNLALMGHTAVFSHGCGQDFHIIYTGGEIGAPRRKGPFHDYPTFFKEYLPNDNDDTYIHDNQARYYVTNDCSVTCSLLKASYESKLPHEKKLWEQINFCNEICGVLCRGAIIENEKWGRLVVKQVLGMEGMKNTGTDGTREAVGIETSQTSKTVKGNATGIVSDIAEVHLPDYSKGTQSEGVRWYAIAQRCISLQHNYLKQKDSKLAKDSVQFNVFRPSGTLLYAVLRANWDVNGEFQSVKTLYTLGTFIARHKFTPTKDTDSDDEGGKKKHISPVWHAGSDNMHTGPMYKALAKINSFFYNKDIVVKPNIAQHPTQQRAVKTVPEPPKKHKETQNNPHAVKTVPETHKKHKKKQNNPSVVPQPPEENDATLNHETPKTDNEGWTEVKTKKMSRKVGQLKTQPRVVPKSTTPGSIGQPSIFDKLPTVAEAGIGHEKTLLAVEAKMASMMSTPIRNLDDHLKLAASCAQTMNLGLV